MTSRDAFTNVAGVCSAIFGLHFQQPASLRVYLVIRISHESISLQRDYQFESQPTPDSHHIKFAWRHWIRLLILWMQDSSDDPTASADSDS